MNIKIKAKNKDQKRLIHKMIFKSIREGWDRIEVTNMRYHREKGGRDYSGCSIQVVDIWEDIEWTKQIPSKEGK